MGARGIPPRPNHLKALEGEREDRINRDEPIPGEGEVRSSEPLHGHALEVWNRLAPDLIDKRVLRPWDADAFAAYCKAVALFREASAEVEQSPITIPGSHGGTVMNPAIRTMCQAADLMIKFGSRFGLTPSDRAQLKITDDGGSKAGAARLLG